MEPFSEVPRNQNQVEQAIMLDRTSEDFKGLFSHFPEEIWLLIIDKIKDSDTLTNLTLASSVFRNLLLSRRVEFLFPQVWKVLGVKFENREGEVYSYDIDEMNTEGALSRFRNRKPPSCTRILTLRSVCKRWCEGMDEFYQNLTETTTYIMQADRMDYWREREFGKCTDKVDFHHARPRSQNFNTHFDATHFVAGNQRSPLISRGTSLLVGSNVFRARRGEAESEILSFLSKCGTHIWFCSLGMYDDFETRFGCYAALKKILRLLPNLKRLKVTYFLNISIVRCTTELDYVKESQDIDSNPLPKLHKMEFLSVNNFPTNFIGALMSANNHISMLEVLRSDSLQCSDIYTLPMPNLKQLSMRYFSKTDFKNLNKPEVSWSLEKIYLDLRFCFSMPWSQIFSPLENKWATTLRTVTIYFPQNYSYPQPTNTINDSGTCIQLNLPKVQRLKLKTREYFSLDFILPMKSLELLEIVMCGPVHGEAIEKQLHLMEKNQIVQFAGYFKRLEESNIWNLFPKLKHLQFGDGKTNNTYTREGCENEVKRVPQIKLET